MYFKIMLILSGILMFLFVPLKVVSDINTIAFVESSLFVSLFLIGLIAIFFLAKFSKISMENIAIRKNIFLGITSVFVAGSFLLPVCTSSYYYDKSLYDFEWQPMVLVILSAFSVLTFLIMAVTFFTGKNLFFKVPFFIFCPVFWFAFNMILFVSVQNDNSDIYDIAFTSFLSLFFLYYTQVFSTSSKANITKLLIGIGIPSVILMFTKCVPVFIKYANDYNSLPRVQLYTCIMETFIAIHIAATVFETCKQVFEKQSLSETN